MHLHTQKQLLYFDEVIRLHFKEGLGEDRIAMRIPLAHSTIISRATGMSKSVICKRIANFALEHKEQDMPQTKTDPKPIAEQDAQARIAELEAKLRKAELARDAYLIYLKNRCKSRDKVLNISPASRYHGLRLLTV